MNLLRKRPAALIVPTPKEIKMELTSDNQLEAQEYMDKFVVPKLRELNRFNKKVTIHPNDLKYPELVMESLQSQGWRCWEGGSGNFYIEKLHQTAKTNIREISFIIKMLARWVLTSIALVFMISGIEHHCVFLVALVGVEVAGWIIHWLTNEAN
jgi:hypothetical protein